jgi:hypothetical protein
MRTVGNMVSCVQVTTAGVGSKLPYESQARMVSVFTPSNRFMTLTSGPMSSQPPLLIFSWKQLPPSVELTVNSTSFLRRKAGGAPCTMVSGGVVSGGGEGAWLPAPEPPPQAASNHIEPTRAACLPSMDFIGIPSRSYFLFCRRAVAL